MNDIWKQLAAQAAEAHEKELAYHAAYNATRGDKKLAAAYASLDGLTEFGFQSWCKQYRISQPNGLKLIALYKERNICNTHWTRVAGVEEETVRIERLERGNT